MKHIKVATTNFQFSFNCIIGGPGSGRTTQCKLLELYTRFSHVSSGDVLRNEVMSGSDRSLKIYNCMLNGDSVPDEIKCDIIGEEMCVRKIRKDNPIKVLQLF